MIEIIKSQRNKDQIIAKSYVYSFKRKNNVNIVWVVSNQLALVRVGHR